jgi:ribosomal protein S8
MIKNKSNNIIANHIISDLVSRIKNRALSPNNNVFEVIYSKDTKYILDLLAEDGYLN